MVVPVGGLLPLPRLHEHLEVVAPVQHEPPSLLSVVDDEILEERRAGGDRTSHRDELGFAEATCGDRELLEQLGHFGGPPRRQGWVLDE